MRVVLYLGSVDNLGLDHVPWLATMWGGGVFGLKYVSSFPKNQLFFKVYIGYET